MCVRTFVKQASVMTGRDFVREVDNGAKHHALSDCRAQVEFLVNARNALKPRPMERTLLSPEVSFSSVGGIVEQAIERTLPNPETSFSVTSVDIEPDFPSTASSFDETLSEHEAFLEILMLSQEVQDEVADLDTFVRRPRVETPLHSPETSFSMVEEKVGQAVRRTLPTPETSFSGPNEDFERIIEAGASSLLGPPPNDPAELLAMFLANDSSEEDETELVNQAPITTEARTQGEPNLAFNIRIQDSGSAPSGGQRARESPYKVVKPAPNGIQRRRNGEVRTPRQLLTPETSFNAEEFELE